MDISISTFPSTKSFLPSSFCIKTAPSQTLHQTTRLVFPKPKSPSFKAALSLCRDDVHHEIPAIQTRHNDNDDDLHRHEEIPLIQGSHMDDVYEALAERLLPMAIKAWNTKSQYIVGIAGSPGSGKSTLASQVAERINAKWPLRPQDVATVIPMDGFHLFRRQLDAMENPEEAHARRGAPWTFDPQRLLKCLQTLKSEGCVYAPSFNHGVGDPVEDDIFVGFEQKLVIVEGNYLLLDDGVWKEVSSMFDEKWFIQIDMDTSMDRVLKRHIATGKTSEIAKWRIDYNDRPNGMMVAKRRRWKHRNVLHGAKS